MRISTLIAAIALLLVAGGADQPAPKPQTPAQRCFDIIKSLEGVWVGRNSEGLPSTMTYKIIAGGSCVMETTEFQAHADTTMVTMYHMDGEHLMLTHYCVARNQPRMRATEIGDDGAAVTFTFLDGTGMADRDVGHMDSAWFHFIDANRMASKWSWYQGGKVTWGEEFTYERQGAESGPAAVPSGQPSKSPGSTATPPSKP
jgi:hypothetical protein